jgi:hypothetical protein
MRRLAVLLAVSLSAGSAMAQDPEDRVPIPASIETWYRIDQNSRQVGWAHETLYTTTMRNYRYDYFFESDYTYTSGEDEAQINEYFKAQLEEDFDVYDLEYMLNLSSVQHGIRLKTYADTEERIVSIEIKSDPAVTREYKFPTSETVHLYLNPMLYRLRQTGSLAQPTRLRERVLVPTQDEPVSVSYSSGAMTTKDYLGKSVKVTEVRIEGWDRGGLAPFSRTWVDKYGRVIEAESADRTMTLIMVKDEATAKGGRKGIIPKGRRDPFDKKDVMTPTDSTKKPEDRDTGPKTRPFVVPNIEKAQYDAVLAESKALIPKLQDEVIKQFNEEARSTYLRILANYKGLYRHVETDPIKRTEVDKLKEDAERIYGGVKKLKDAIAGKLDRINDLYLNDNLEGIDRELKELDAMRQAPEFFRSEDGIAELENAIRAAQAKRNQTLARIELGRKSLVLTGTITATEVVQDVVKFDLFIGGSRLALSQPVSIRKQMTMAVINDEAYKEGDIVQREGVTIQKIHRHAVEVEYKGEVRQVVLRK